MEKCCNKSKLYKNFIDISTILQAFYCDKGLLRKFKATCFEDCKDLVSMFDNIPTVHIDWRWESLCTALDLNIPLLPVLKAQFDKDKLESRDGSSMLTNSTAKSPDKIFKEEVNFVPVAEMMRIYGKITEKYAGLLEICDCHPEVWSRGMKKKANNESDARTH